MVVCLKIAAVCGRAGLVSHEHTGQQAPRRCSLQKGAGPRPGHRPLGSLICCSSTVKGVAMGNCPREMTVAECTRDRFLSLLAGLIGPGQHQVNQCWLPPWETGSQPWDLPVAMFLYLKDICTNVYQVPIRCLALYCAFYIQDLNYFSQ